MTETSWIGSLNASFRSQTATWFVGFVVAILTIFSSQVTESIKFGFNKADIRTKNYEELVSEVSQYIFSAELNVEFIENEWTTRQTLTKLIEDYNKYVMTLRKKEFVYLAWLRKYWSQKEAEKFNAFMDSVKTYDSSLHALNDEFEAVNITRTKQKVDPKRAEEALMIMKPALKELREKGTLLVESL